MIFLEDVKCPRAIDILVVVSFIYFIDPNCQLVVNGLG